MNEEQIVEILTKVSRRIAKNKKYIFDGHEEIDIVQRGIYEGLKAIKKGLYDAKKGNGATPEESLERFMTIHIRRRLSNYKRDMMRKNFGGVNNEFINPISLESANMVCSADVIDHADKIMHDEMIVRIKSALSSSPEMLTDFYRLMDGSQLPSQRKIKLRQRVIEILEELNYGVQEED